MCYAAQRAMWSATGSATCHTACHALCYAMCYATGHATGYAAGSATCYATSYLTCYTACYATCYMSCMHICHGVAWGGSPQKLNSKWGVSGWKSPFWAFLQPHTWSRMHVRLELCAGRASCRYHIRSTAGLAIRDCAGMQVLLLHKQHSSCLSAAIVTTPAIHCQVAQQVEECIPCAVTH